MPAAEPTKKRGRPKKASTEDVEVIRRTASTKAAGKEKEKASKKNVKAALALASAKQDMQKVAADAVAVETPVTPANSKILEEVRKSGGVKSLATAAAASSKKKSKASQAKQTAVPNAEAPMPPSPSIKPRPSQTTPAAPSSPSTPAAQPPLPPLPPHSPSSPLLQPRATTIPLPEHPSPAPSPTTRPPAALFKTSQSKPLPTRIVYPQLDQKMPDKYKPAARRVTAIIVALPFCIVLSYELWRRWKQEVIAKRYDEEGHRIDKQGNRYN